MQVSRKYPQKQLLQEVFALLQSSSPVGSLKAEEILLQYDFFANLLKQSIYDRQLLSDIAQSLQSTQVTRFRLTPAQTTEQFDLKEQKILILVEGELCLIIKSQTNLSPKIRPRLSKSCISVFTVPAEPASSIAGGNRKGQSRQQILKPKLTPSPQKNTNKKQQRDHLSIDSKIAQANLMKKNQQQQTSAIAAQKNANKIEFYAHQYGNCWISVEINGLMLGLHSFVQSKRFSLNVLAKSDCKLITLSCARLQEILQNSEKRVTDKGAELYFLLKKQLAIKQYTQIQQLIPFFESKECIAGEVIAAQQNVDKQNANNQSGMLYIIQKGMYQVQREVHTTVLDSIANTLTDKLLTIQLAKLKEGAFFGEESLKASAYNYSLVFSILASDVHAKLPSEFAQNVLEAFKIKKNNYEIIIDKEISKINPTLAIRREKSLKTVQKEHQWKNQNETQSIRRVFYTSKKQRQIAEQAELFQRLARPSIPLADQLVFLKNKVQDFGASEIEESVRNRLRVKQLQELKRQREEEQREQEIKRAQKEKDAVLFSAALRSSRNLSRKESLKDYFLSRNKQRREEMRKVLDNRKDVQLPVAYAWSVRTQTDSNARNEDVVLNLSHLSLDRDQISNIKQNNNNEANKQKQLFKRSEMHYENRNPIKISFQAKARSLSPRPASPPAVNVALLQSRIAHALAHSTSKVKHILENQEEFLSATVTIDQALHRQRNGGRPSHSPHHQPQAADLSELLDHGSNEASLNTDLLIEDLDDQNSYQAGHYNSSPKYPPFILQLLLQEQLQNNPQEEQRGEQKQLKQLDTARQPFTYQKQAFNYKQQVKYNSTSSKNYKRPRTAQNNGSDARKAQLFAVATPMHLQDTEAMHAIIQGGREEYQNCTINNRCQLSARERVAIDLHDAFDSTTGLKISKTTTALQGIRAQICQRNVFRRQKENKKLVLH